MGGKIADDLVGHAMFWDFFFKKKKFLEEHRTVTNLSTWSLLVSLG